MGIFNKLKNVFSSSVINDSKKYEDGLKKTRNEFISELSKLSSKYKNINDDYFSDLEDILVMSDIGINTVLKFVDRLKDRVKSEKITSPEFLKEVIIDELFVMYVNNDVVKHIYTQGVFAEKVFLDGGAIKVEYKDVDDSLSKINNEMSILSETKDGKAEGIIIYSNYDLVQKDTRFIIITPRAYSGNVKLHSEFENVVVNSKKIVYLNSSDIKDLKVKFSEDKYTYDGNAKTPEVTIKGLIKDVDYKVSYSDNVKPGKASVKVDGIDMFTGSVIVNFTIEKKPEVKTVTKTVVKKTTPVKKKVKKTEKVYKVGYKFKDSSFIYAVRKVGTKKKTGEVKIVGLRNRKSTKVVIKRTVKYKKIRYNVTEINTKAFNKLKKLKRITIGKNVKLIGSYAFADCSNLERVTFKTVVIKKIGKDAFANLSEEFIIKVPSRKNKRYKKLLKKSGYEGIIK